MNNDIEKALQCVDEVITSSLSQGPGFLRTMADDSALDKGKRLRARLVLCFCPDLTGLSIKAAAAVELLHAATLVHDDMIDRAGRRRGRPSLYKSHGHPRSILFGDYLFSRSFQLLAETGNKELWLAANTALSEVISGEMEHQFRKNDLSLTREEYLDIVSRKTGALFSAACTMGVISSGSPEAGDRARECGYAMGTAYQVLDDCMDYMDMGQDKENRRDLENGFITLPLLELLDVCSREERCRIARMLEPHRADPSDHEDIINMMRRYNALSRALGECSALIDRVEHRCGCFPHTEKITGYLREKVKDAQKAYSDSRSGVCGSKRSEGTVPQQ